MELIRRYRWLVVGALAGTVVPATGLGQATAGWLDAWAPLPWRSLGAGLLLFAVGAALHFRSGWVEAVATARQRRERQEAAARLLDEALFDAHRSVGILADNLEVVTGGEQRPADAELYLSGAAAHADKLVTVLERIDGVRRRLAGESRSSA